MKILNLYACLGGNRYKWDEVTDIEVTAIEIDPKLAELYKERFPNDKVIVTDAHRYLLDNFKDYDFIWSSPPCPTHSSIRVSQKNRPSFKVKYPDMKLYEEIILLSKLFKGYYCVENVIPYYTPLIPGKKRGRHIYWTNFNLPSSIGRSKATGLVGQTKDEIKKLCEFHDYNFLKYKGSQRRDKIARNLVDYEAGREILTIVDQIVNNKPSIQKGLFEGLF